MSILNNAKKIHFVGILGSGMSAIAQYLCWNGYKISGSDRECGSKSVSAIESKLLDCGIMLYKQDGSGIDDDTNVVIVSTAIEENNPDIIRARELGINIYHRSDILADIIVSRKTIAVAGTSGKSSTTAMIFTVLQNCGIDASIINGAALNLLKEKNIYGNAYYGKSDILVIEADESDGTLVKYKPYLSVFLNVSLDHKPVEDTTILFKKLADNSFISIKNADDKNLDNLKTEKCFSVQNVNSDYCFIKQKETDTGIEVMFKNNKFILPFIGDYMLQNSAAAISVTMEFISDFNCIINALANYKGVERRFNIYNTKSGVKIIDDYAHNPEKLKAAIRTAQKITQGKLYIIFRPHGFKPLKIMYNELKNMFSKELKSDTLILRPVYYAGGTVTKEITSMDLYKELSMNINVLYFESTNEIFEYLSKNVKTGDTILSTGARDPYLPEFAKKIYKLFDN